METELFKKLLAEGKDEEAQELLEGFLANSISPREQGDALLAYAAASMDAENALNEERVKILRKAVEELKVLQKDFTETTDTLEYIKARKTIDQS